MTASVVDFSSLNDHPLTNLSEYWDDWYQYNPTSSMLLAAPIPSTIEPKLALDPTLQSMIASAGFVNPGCLQSYSTESISSFSSQGVDDETLPSTKNKRRKRSRDLKPTAPLDDEQFDAPHRGPPRKRVAKPAARERNRNAAAKCRAKSKAAEEVLKGNQRIERERNQILRASFNEVHNEVLMLKHELFRHSACNHPVIDNYLRRSADQISGD